MEVAELLERVRPVVLAGQRALPVHPVLGDLLPEGLKRGTTVAVAGAGGVGRPAIGCGATSLVLALLAAASAEGCWCALVGMPEVSPRAAVAMGLDLGRMAWVPDPGPQWPTVVSALLDGLDLVALGPDRLGRPRPGDARRLAARARLQSSVLVVGPGPWPESCDLSLQVGDPDWGGLGSGHGQLGRRRLQVSVGGRRGASRTRRSQLWLPGLSGALEHPDGEVVVPRWSEDRPAG